MNRTLAMSLLALIAFIVCGVLGMFAAMKLSGYPEPHGHPVYYWSKAAIRTRELGLWALVLPGIAAIAAFAAELESKWRRVWTALLFAAIVGGALAPIWMLTIAITEPRHSLLLKIGDRPVESTDENGNSRVR